MTIRDLFDHKRLESAAAIAGIQAQRDYSYRLSPSTFEMTYGDRKIDIGTSGLTIIARSLRSLVRAHVRRTTEGNRVNRE